LQFIPSWYAESSSTPGITALARFGHWLGFGLEVGSFSKITVLNRTKPPVADVGNSKFPFPREVCDHIVGHLSHPADILRFRSISPACHSAAAWILRYPHVDGHRLLSAIGRPPGNSTTKENNAQDGERDLNKEYPNLHLAKFKAFKNGEEVFLELGYNRSEGRAYKMSGSVDIGSGLVHILQYQRKLFWRYLPLESDGCSVQND
jgi:hypothetical protein